MIHDLSDSTKHWLDLVAFGGVAVSGFSLAGAALAMSFLAATCSVLWFIVRLYDRIKYGPNVSD